MSTANPAAPAPAPSPVARPGAALTALRLAVLLLLAGLIVMVVGRLTQPAPPREDRTILDRVAATPGPADYATALRWAEDGVLNNAARVVQGGGDWLAQELYASTLLTRARLTGSAEDYARAGAALARGNARSVKGAGPMLVTAQYALAVHRPRDAVAPLEDYLRQGIPPSEAERAGALAMLGDAALFGGDLDGARRRYDEATALWNDPTTHYRLARWYRKRGDPEGALDAFARVVRGTRVRMPEFVAQLYLQLGALALDQGDWAAAERRFAQADARFPGWWLAKAHRAEMRAALGDAPGAERLYREALAIHPDPSVMDGYAALLRSAGRAGDARALAARAGTEWARRMRIAPSATIGHALEHELAWGRPDRALALARANQRLRPDGDAAVLLGWALLANGRADAAIAAVEPLERAGWTGWQTYAVLAEAYALAARGRDADTARAAALDRNPRAFDPGQSLLWFGTH